MFNLAYTRDRIIFLGYNHDLFYQGLKIHQETLYQAMKRFCFTYLCNSWNIESQDFKRRIDNRFSNAVASRKILAGDVRTF